MAFTNTSSPTTLLPPKKRQTNTGQSSIQFENSTTTNLSFQAPTIQGAKDRSRVPQSFPNGELITTFLPPTVKEHKKPKLPQSNLNLGGITNFLPPKINNSNQPVVKTIPAEHSAINFRTNNDLSKTLKTDTLPQDFTSIQPLKENPIVDTPAISHKVEMELNSSDISSTSTTFLDFIPKNTPSSREETQLFVNQLGSPLDIISSGSEAENQIPTEPVKVQPQIIEETNLYKGLGYIVFIGFGIGGLVLLAFAWFLLGEPQSLSNASEKPTKEKKLPPIKNPEEEQRISIPSPIAYAQVVTKTGSSLIIRAEKSKMSAQLGIIPYQAKVEILEYATYYSVLDGENGKWVYVKYKDKIGWCWGNFLKEVPK